MLCSCLLLEYREEFIAFIGSNKLKKADENQKHLLSSDSIVLIRSSVSSCIVELDIHNLIYIRDNLRKQGENTKYEI